MPVHIRLTQSLACAPHYNPLQRRPPPHHPHPPRRRRRHRQCQSRHHSYHNRHRHPIELGKHTQLAIRQQV